jgi:hypothetical protein
MSELPVPVVSPPQPPAAQTLVCANCGSALAGEYCAACGQRNEPHVHTVVHFAGEAFESISHADSRLWRTLWYLLARPGYLTREFFDGRRARYLPPFRLYLVVSVVFFLVVGVPSETVLPASDPPTAEAIESMKSAADALEKELGPGSEALRKIGAGLRRQAEKDSAALARGEGADAADDGSAAAELTAQAPESSAKKKKEGLQPKNAMTDFCDEFKEPDARGNESYANLQAFCAKTAEDGGAELAKSIGHNIPRAMFVFLPLLALVMKLLYWRPKRYYVEHLLFLIHNHAFVFLALAILGLLKLIPKVGQHLGTLEFAIWVYMIWYIYRGMRNVYRQGRGLTLVKYFAIGYAYILAGVTVLVLTALFSAMTYS